MAVNCIRVGVPQVLVGFKTMDPLVFEWSKAPITTGGIKVTEHWCKDDASDTVEFDALTRIDMLETGMSVALRLIMPVGSDGKQESVYYDYAKVLDIVHTIPEMQVELWHYEFKCSRHHKRLTNGDLEN